MQLETVNVHALETALTVAGLNEVGRAMVQELTKLLTAAEERGHQEGFEEGFNEGCDDVLEAYEAGYEAAEKGASRLSYDEGFDDGFDYGDDQGYEEGYADASAIYSGNSTQPGVVFYPECSGYEPYFLGDLGEDPREATAQPAGWQCGVCGPFDETCAAVNCPEGTPPSNPFDDEFVPKSQRLR